MTSEQFDKQRECIFPQNNPVNPAVIITLAVLNMPTVVTGKNKISWNRLDWNI